jgi:hypothetical protein
MHLAHCWEIELITSRFYDFYYLIMPYEIQFLVSFWGLGVLGLGVWGFASEPWISGTQPNSSEYVFSNLYYLNLSMPSLLNNAPMEVCGFRI